MGRRRRFKGRRERFGYEVVNLYVFEKIIDCRALFKDCIGARNEVTLQAAPMSQPSRRQPPQPIGSQKPLKNLLTIYKPKTYIIPNTLRVYHIRLIGQPSLLRLISAL